MKLIIAVVPSELQQAVETAMYGQEVSLVSVSQVFGDAREPGHKETYRGRTVNVRRQKVRLKMAAQDLFADYAVAAIERACSNGNDSFGGSSRIVVLPLEEYVLIGRGEREPAVRGKDAGVVFSVR